MYKAIMGVLVVLLFVLAVSLSEWRDKAFQKKMDEADAKIQQMTIDHAKSMEIAQKVMERREEVLEREKEKFCDAQKAMGNNPDFCATPVPDDLRLLFQNSHKPEDSKLPAPVSSSGAN